jgi:hypothetical protein
MKHFCGGSIFHNLISFLVSGFFDSFWYSFLAFHLFLPKNLRRVTKNFGGNAAFPDHGLPGFHGSGLNRRKRKQRKIGFGPTPTFLEMLAPGPPTQ